jgi:drug/metabolite transporter (DMT)-like permease
MPKKRRIGAYGALAIGVIAIAWSAIFVRWTQMPGIVSAFYRMFIASVVLWPILLLSKAKLADVSRSTFLLAALSGVFFAGDVGFFNTAVLHTSAGSATFLGNNAPLLVGLLTWAITRKIPSRRFWTALAIALSGAWLIVAVDARHAASELSADLQAVMASIFFALYLLTTERSRKAIDTLVLVTVSATASAAVLVVMSAVAHLSLVVPSMQSLAAVLGLGLVCQLTGYFCLTYALGHLPATVTSVVLLAVGPLTAVFAFGLFGERMTLLQIVGGVFVIFGVWIVSRVPAVVPQDSEENRVLDTVV